MRVLVVGNGMVGYKFCEKLRGRSEAIEPENGGACVKYKELQVAVFNFDQKKMVRLSKSLSTQNANDPFTGYDRIVW